MKSAIYTVFSVYDNDRQGSEVAQVTASTYKWGPGNAMEVFVETQRPKAGKYIVVGPGSPTTKLVWCKYTVAYPNFTIEGTRSGGIQIYGEQQEKEEEAT